MQYFEILEAWSSSFATYARVLTPNKGRVVVTSAWFSGRDFLIVTKLFGIWQYITIVDIMVTDVNFPTFI